MGEWAVVSDLEEKDEKLQSTFKQLEMKNLEVQKFRTAAELAKVGGGEGGERERGERDREREG